MAEYIDREALIAHIKDLPTWWADAGGVYGRSMKYPEGMFDCEDVISLVENAPAADVAPVVHGKDLAQPSLFKCSVCGCEDDDTYTCDVSKYRYCPNCGAKIDEEENKE